jgi:hypothetical protein
MPKFINTLRVIASAAPLVFSVPARSDECVRLDGGYESVSPEDIYDHGSTLYSTTPNMWCRNGSARNWGQSDGLLNQTVKELAA